MDTYLPPKYSLNSFFVRHVAHPRRMKYISGLGNSKICSVNDVGFINYNNSLQQQQQQHQNNGAYSSMSNALQRLEFPPNNFNEELLKNDSLLFKRRERAVPPNGMWNTFGLSKFKFYSFFKTKLNKMNFKLITRKNGAHN